MKRRMRNRFLQLRSRRSNWRACFWSAAMMALFTSPLAPRAQDTNYLAQTNELMQSDDTSNDASVAGDEETAGTNVVSDTNEVTTPGPDGRTRRRRRMQSRPKDTNRDARPGAADTNSPSSALDYPAFRLIVDRNIFDPNRAPRTSRPTAQPKTTDAFTLVGTMSYEKGVFAFFDGTSSDYKKALKPDETIAGYKVASISADSVKLAHDTNIVDLAVGTQIRRRDDGAWEKSASSETYSASASNNSSSASSPPSGADNDVLKRMMMRREKE